MYQNPAQSFRVASSRGAARTTHVARHAVLDFLAAVSLATAEQAGRFLGVTAAEAARELVRLRRGGGVGSVEVLVRRLPWLTTPGYSSAEGTLDANLVERKLRRRWEGIEPIVETVFFLGRGLARPAHVEHDIHVADVLLHYQRARPDLAWLSERQFTEVFDARGGRNPDGALRDATGKVVTVVDFAGSYRAPKLTQIVNYWRSTWAGVPVELW